MINRMYQIDIAQKGVGILTEVSIKPGTNQRIVIDYLFAYGYFANAADHAQIDTYGVAATDRKTLLYMQPSAAVHYGPNAVQLNLPLFPGEWIQVYGSGTAATSDIVLIVWYHIEDITNIQSGNVVIQNQPCGFIDSILGRCN